MSPEPRGSLADGRTRDAIQTLHAALLEGSDPPHFTRPAVDALHERQREFAVQLGTAAIHRAWRARADVVSAVDVQHAADEAGAVRSRRVTAIEAAGGVLTGVGGGELLELFRADEPTALAMTVATVVLVLGLVLLTAAFTRR